MNSGARRRSEHQPRGPDERAVPRPDVGEIDEQEVDRSEVLGARRKVFEAIAVETHDWGGGAGIDGARNTNHVLRLAAPAVLRPEQQRWTNLERRKRTRDVNELTRHA